MPSTPGDLKTIRDALTFTSPLLPNPQETSHLRNDLRANHTPRETTRLRAVVSSAPSEIALYEKYATVLGLVQANAPVPGIVTPHSDRDTSFPSPLAIPPSPQSGVLPPEVLIQVFHLSIPTDYELNSKDYTTEIKRLTHHDLLRLAQVCVHWRALALGTPAFWRVLEMDLAFWSPKMLPLVHTALERSANSPLVVRIGAPELADIDRSLLELIAQHCDRWQAVLFYMSFASYGFLSSIRGNLPLLECAHIVGDWDDSAQVASMATAAVGLFARGASARSALETTPTFRVPGSPSFRTLRRSFHITIFPPSMHFELRRLMSLPTSLTEGLALVPQPVVSDLTDLTVEFAWHTSGAMADTLQRLTLPSLSSLEVAVVSPYKWNPPAHPSHRPGLPPAGRALACAASDSELAVFGCLSLLRFDEAVYLDFVRSRFESHIRWHPSSARELNPAVSEELQRLSKEQGFMGSIDAANEQEMQTFFY
ncbi:hypothetical protein B0H14DRAFT_2889489 [Mycena olivaceomarginata]|nr:hypothetical protein B0H14DRAFT_2889489 [Mycena olivaceomarginata]